MTSTSTAPPPAGVAWLPYQCPSCLGLFRVQRSQIGETGQCPACEALVRIIDPAAQRASVKASIPAGEGAPAIKARPAPIMELSTRETEDQAEWSDQARRRKRHIPGGRVQGINWEDSKEFENRGIPWMPIVSVFTCGVLAFAVYSYWEKNRPKGKNSGGIAFSENILDYTAVDASLALTENEEEILEKTATEEVERFEKFDITRIREVLASFLNAATLDEKIRHVREKDRVGPLMKAYYKTHGFEVEGMDKMLDQKVSYRKDFVSLSVRTTDYSIRAIALKLENGEYAVDWESWVGYCSMDVEEMKRRRPTKPVTVRVNVNPKDYYNYDFKDDQVWKSVQLIFNEEEHTLYGYVKKDAAFLKKIIRNSVSPMTLKVVYPRNARSGGQVEIVEYVTEGWVQGVDAK